MKRKSNLTNGVLMMTRVREILRLKESQGLSQREIHRATGIARSCIQRYLQTALVAEVSYERACQLSDEELRDALSRKEPSWSQPVSGGAALP